MNLEEIKPYLTRVCEEYNYSTFMAAFYNATMDQLEEIVLKAMHLYHKESSPKIITRETIAEGIKAGELLNVSNIQSPNFEKAARNFNRKPNTSIEISWQECPVGTKVFALMGGYWYKTERGWKWNGPNGCGGVFPTPGGDATSKIELPVLYELYLESRDMWLLEGCPEDKLSSFDEWVVNYAVHTKEVKPGENKFETFMYNNHEYIQIKAQDFLRYDGSILDDIIPYIYWHHKTFNSEIFKKMIEISIIEEYKEALFGATHNSEDWRWITGYINHYKPLDIIVKFNVIQLP